ncbi:hypothetical protein PhCBS80983_g02777 [Powellomyces hirtus]|uniref:Uncharacterized protein n=1 Tax=Powellomyces hirtus TaxID=109895 RepID=A0A507E533_9FUNG|nr:hypothetical protein PhCBS80983_g02777 [Powellomyces hirtus]
MRRSLNKTSTR